MDSTCIHKDAEETLEAEDPEVGRDELADWSPVCPPLGNLLVPRIFSFELQADVQGEPECPNRDEQGCELHDIRNFVFSCVELETVGNQKHQ